MLLIATLCKAVRHSSRPHSLCTICKQVEKDTPRNECPTLLISGEPATSPVAASKWAGTRRPFLPLLALVTLMDRHRFSPRATRAVGGAHSGDVIRAAARMMKSPPKIQKAVVRNSTGERSVLCCRHSFCGQKHVAGVWHATAETWQSTRWLWLCAWHPFNRSSRIGEMAIRKLPITDGVRVEMRWTVKKLLPFLRGSCCPFVHLYLLGGALRPGPEKD